MSQIRIVVADDHEVVRMGIKAMIQQNPSMVVVAEADNGEEAVKQALKHRPDIVVMDVRMPQLGGIDACKQITERAPEVRVVMLTTFAEDDLLFAAIRAGAAGYVLKRIGNDDLVRTIEQVARGESAIDPAMVSSVFREVALAEKQKEASVFSDLSPQELRVLASIADGMTNREIASKLFLGEGTVRNYVSSILGKLNLSNRAEAAAFAVQHHVKDIIGSE
ncbi:MAG: response regulator transcription factor [Chloroflexi bacterium]|jgi:DNA-binding NarL/FixJ family response regulator|nr:MAG: putative NarL family two-component system response regulator [Chloroflexi bacterium OLB13]MBV6435282.1 DNA-binding transcriptional activator DevR/DosR [Anaerolineae bacterium]MCC6566836.1 response regulator transcription factor [Chloroflexota bacterium]MDL1916190.1 response regulator transcription factor [Anaerolineae bacterium CFX4]OQY82062.1 MAG: DNA-binding response regulator [Anaerolineae bacterium UTCFX5]